MNSYDDPLAPFAEPLHVGRPVVGDQALFLEHIESMLQRQMFTNNGPLLLKLESAVAAYLGVRHVVAVNNATIALMLAAEAMELKGEVIMPSFTFIATAHAMAWQGLRPVFVEVDKTNGLLDPAAVEAAITPHTSAILGVHLWGKACDVEALAHIAQKHNIQLFFDAAHAFGAGHQSTMIGNFGRCECFSLHSTKVFHSLEGGLITTNEDALASRLRLLRNFGITGEDQCAGLGINAKMTEACAAMGLANLSCLERIVAVNKACWQEYYAGLQGLDGLDTIHYNADERHNYHYVMLRVDEARFGLSRDALYTILKAKNVLARRYFTPGCHRLPPYNQEALVLPRTETLSSQCLVLPSGAQMQEGFISKVCAIIRNAHKRGNRA